MSYGALRRDPRLVTLGDTTLVFARPGQDIRGRRVMDASAGIVGIVYGFYLDECERKIRFLAVRCGKLPETATFVIPADAVRNITPDLVVIDAHHPGLPYNPTLVEREPPSL